MILIGDIGSTSGDWVLVQNTTVKKRFSSIGFNPIVQQTDDFDHTLSQLSDNIPDFSSINNLFYYGSGIIPGKTDRALKTKLRESFPQAFISMHSDLLAAAQACCGDLPGIVCILGTGSNCCFYDGTVITQQSPSLGFYLGDEGSGAHIGKELVRDYYYQKMPAGLLDKFSDFLPRDRGAFLQHLQNETYPNRYLSKFAKFATMNKNHVYIRQLIAKVFDEFIDRHLSHFDSSEPIHFVGSIAYYLRELLEHSLISHNYNPGKFIAQPIESLTEIIIKKIENG
jgi:N-acetylglucosamine kinase-like BadF-type ATPase